ncbi:hypothetical protein Hypma_003220 [Hypsizygus marmoreus]|uniref:Uncharacterized protein n=1 Tax=Hypsizygus marmoreus TaxID=39966 RepID=A0A369K4S4_HYPMA|nr:hypothetical protein Hypma_003220 [Hypsizygus marmoreus]
MNRPNSPAFYEYPAKKPVFGLILDRAGQHRLHRLAHPEGPAWDEDYAPTIFIEDALQVIQDKTGVLCDWITACSEPRDPYVMPSEVFVLLAFDGVDENNSRTTQEERRKVLELFGKSETDLAMGYLVHPHRY